MQPPGPTSSLTRVYGFVTLLTALALILFYLFLALAPSALVYDALGRESEGIQRIAGTIPVLVSVSIVYVLIAYAFVGLMYTPALDDYRLITDRHARPWPDKAGEVPLIADLPKVMWSRHLVQSMRENAEAKSAQKAKIS